jgi:hypothetical protein
MVKMMKEGLNLIDDSMLQECRKRNAALEDLEEGLEKVRDTAGAQPRRLPPIQTHRTRTPERLRRAVGGNRIERRLSLQACQASER